jgi:hypothetical protein
VKPNEQGQTTILIVGLSLLAFSVAGLAIDGTRAFILRRSLQNAADSATVAGAGELDRDTYYSSQGKKILLDPSAATGVAESYISRRVIPAESTVEADVEGVYVVVRAESPTTFLRLIGIAAIPVAVESRAEPQTELTFDTELN